jgi:iron complex transport system permease protein
MIKHTKRLFLPLIFFLVGTVVVSLMLGKYPVPVREIGSFFLNKIFSIGDIEPSRLRLLNNLLIEIRLPRIIAGVVIGASLAVSGATYQAIFVNPLVSPSILGVLAGASFGAALGMIFAKTWFGVQALTFCFGLAAVFISIGIARMHRGNALLLLILGGVISGAFFTAMLSIMKYIADPYNQLPVITQWLMGSLSFCDKHTAFFSAITQSAGILIIIAMSGYINALSLGDDEARALGVPVGRIRMTLIFISTVISAMTVVMAGMIGWVGLIIPHIARMLVGPDNKVLIPACALIGASYLVIVDDVSRLMFNIEVPIGITTSLIGIPFFVLILKKTRKGWN